jgi:hypothetical protein
MLREVLVLVSVICVVIHGQEGPPEYNEEICIGQEDGALFPIDGYCALYYYCDQEYGYLDDCRNYGDFLFDAAYGNCNDADQVDCVDYVYPDPDPDPVYPDPEPETAPPVIIQTTQAPSIETRPPNPDLIPDVECPTNRNGEILFFESANCSEYYICANGNKMTMRCSEGFVFNIDEKQCDHPVYSPRCSVRNIL